MGQHTKHSAEDRAVVANRNDGGLTGPRIPEKGPKLTFSTTVAQELTDDKIITGGCIVEVLEDGSIRRNISAPRPRQLLLLNPFLS